MRMKVRVRAASGDDVVGALTCIELAADAHDLAVRGAEDGGAEREWASVDEAHKLLLTLERYDSDQRAEDLLLQQAHRGLVTHRYARELDKRRRKELALFAAGRANLLAAAHHLGTMSARILDKGRDALCLARQAEGADVDAAVAVGIERWALAHRRCDAREPSDKALHKAHLAA